MALTLRRAFQTIFGSPLGESTVAVDTKAGTASAVALVQPDGTEKVLWIQNDGKVYVGTAAQRTALTGGTVVGSQA